MDDIAIIILGLTVITVLWVIGLFAWEVNEIKHELKHRNVLLKEQNRILERNRNGTKET